MKDWVDSSTWSGDKENGQLTDNRILHCRSHYYDWCSAVSKNATCDHIRFTQVACVELTLTEQYWKKLLSKTKSAAFLRREIADAPVFALQAKEQYWPQFLEGDQSGQAVHLSRWFDDQGNQTAGDQCSRTGVHPKQRQASLGAIGQGSKALVKQIQNILARPDHTRLPGCGTKNQSIK